jgi:SAM-dependent methyltransferase
MTVFGPYSRYYDLLYRDKDYAGEAEYVHGLLQKHHPVAKSILDLGCGTGRHDLLLAQKGYNVNGVDLSGEMLAVAERQIEEGVIKAHKSGSVLPLSFSQGDLRSIRLNRTFDAVISLFHVMSYQATNDDLLAAFVTARNHLAPGGVFIFDCWYGPAVLTDRPAVRIRSLEDNEIAVTRFAEPVIHPNENLVDVNYLVFVRDKASGEVEELKETHRMRYLFLPEIKLLLRDAGLSIVEAREWVTERQPGFDTWGVYVVAGQGKG